MLSMSDSHRSLLQVMNQVVDQYFYHSNLRNGQNASQPALPSLGCVHCYFIIQTLPVNAQKQVGFCVAQNIQPQDNTFAQILVLLLKSHTVVISNVIYKIISDGVSPFTEITRYLRIYGQSVGAQMTKYANGVLNDLLGKYIWAVMACNPPTCHPTKTILSVNVTDGQFINIILTSDLSLFASLFHCPHS